MFYRSETELLLGSRLMLMHMHAQYTQQMAALF